MGFFTTTNSISEEQILQSLRSVRDPDLHKDIVTLGFVKNIQITNRDVSFTIELTTPACPVRDELKMQAETELRKTFPLLEKIVIEMTAQVRTSVRPQLPILQQVKNTIAVASGKGGVGKSTVAANLAVALATEGAKVGLLDADIYGPSIPLMMGISNGRPQIFQQKIFPVEKYNVKIMSIGFLVDPMQAIVWRGPMASGALKQFITDVEWGELDYLIFDLPPGTGDIQLTLAQTLPLTGAVIVTTPQEISLADVRKGFAMFEKVNVPTIGIVENMSYYICSHCGNRENIFDYGGGNTASKQLGVPFLGEIPISTGTRIGGDEGVPIVLKEPESEQAQAFLTVARNMAAQISIQHLSKDDSASTVDIQLESN
ncbi:MAG: iron-sulfur cluster carrier protein ApbC [Ignavibacteria bacterium]|nr:iron-sulfur cluster carrier protein ApbC [Ignavibacteria bacterium]